MAVIKEYKCSDCNRIFDSSIPSCIHCGSTNVTRIFVTPFGFKSDRTKFSDDNIKAQVEAYGLTDYSNNENTKHTPERKSHWGEVPKTGDTIHPSLATGAFPVKELKERAPGKFHATYHKEDQK